MHTQFCNLEMLKMVTEIENGSVTLKCIDILKVQSNMYDEMKFTNDKGELRLTVNPISVKIIKN